MKRTWRAHEERGAQEAQAWHMGSQWNIENTWRAPADCMKRTQKAHGILETSNGECMGNIENTQRSHGKHMENTWRVREDNVERTWGAHGEY